MGDTPSVAWLLKGTPEDPAKPGWGGQFVRAWERPTAHFDRLTTKDDRMELFGILELSLPLGNDHPMKPEARLLVENRALIGHIPGDGIVRFRFSPKAATSYRFTIRSNTSALDGQMGGITAVAPKRRWPRILRRGFLTGGPTTPSRISLRVSTMVRGQSTAGERSFFATLAHA